MPGISFHVIDTAFKLPQQQLLRRWLRDVIVNENFTLFTLSFIFCSDSYLIQVNRQYLQHDYFTDVITFSYNPGSNQIEGDIFVSIERVRENAIHLAIPFFNELHRVMLHGVLHLTGYNDSTSAQILQIREKEDYYLSLLTI